MCRNNWIVANSHFFLVPNDTIYFWKIVVCFTNMVVKVAVTSLGFTKPHELRPADSKKL